MIKCLRQHTKLRFKQNAFRVIGTCNFVIMKVNICNHQLPGNPPRTSFSYRRLITRGRCWKYTFSQMQIPEGPRPRQANIMSYFGSTESSTTLRSGRSTPCVRFALPLHQECLLSRLLIHHGVLESCGLNFKITELFHCTAKHRHWAPHILYSLCFLVYCFPIIPV